MPQIETVTESHGTTTTNRWWSGLFTLQNIVMIGAAISAIVTFWNTQKNHSSHLDQLDKVIEVIHERKSDDADLKALSERVSRQYETNNKILERIIEVEKKLSYEAGKADGEREERRRQRNDRGGN